MSVIPVTNLVFKLVVMSDGPLMTIGILTVMSQLIVVNDDGILLTSKWWYSNILALSFSRIVDDLLC